MCDSDLFPNIYILLQVITIFFVSASTADRPFSTLKNLNNWLCANIGKQRLRDLILLNFHRDIITNVNNIITRFSNKTKEDWILSCTFLKNYEYNINMTLVSNKLLFFVRCKYCFLFWETWPPSTNFNSRSVPVKDNFLV